MDFSHFTATDWANAASNLLVPILTGLIAFAGVITGLEMKRRTDRRVERETRLAEAMKELQQFPARMSAPPANDELMRTLANAWAFDWVISRKKELPVAEWYGSKVMELERVRRMDIAPIRKEIHAYMEVAEIVEELNRWRLGTRKPKWFKAEAARLDRADASGPDPSLRVTLSATATFNEAPPTETGTTTS